MNCFGWVKWGAFIACLLVFLLLKNGDTMSLFAIIHCRNTFIIKCVVRD